MLLILFLFAFRRNIFLEERGGDFYIMQHVVINIYYILYIYFINYVYTFVYICVCLCVCVVSFLIIEYKLYESEKLSFYSPLL